MLYQTRRANAARRLLALIGGLFAEVRRTTRDTTYVAGLNDFRLRDLGLSRVDREIRRVYR